MATTGKSGYKDRFGFSDPLTKTTASRTTRYRLLKKRKASHLDEQTEEYQEPVHDVVQGEVSNYVPDLNDQQSSMELTPGVSQETPTVSAEVNTCNVFTLDWEAEGTQYMYLLEEDEADVAEIMDDASDGEDSPTPPYFEGEERGSVKFPSVCQPVYDGSTLTSKSSNLLIKQYSMKHKLSKEALSDLLKLIQLHCPKPNTVPCTVYQFEKQFADLNKSQRLHHFCSFCLQGVLQEDIHCSNPFCEREFISPHAKSYFVEISVEDQLQTLFARML